MESLVRFGEKTLVREVQKDGKTVKSREKEERCTNHNHQVG